MDHVPSKESPSNELSPLSRSRYGRTHKPKISEDFYNIDVIFELSKEPRKSPRNVPQVKSPARTKQTQSPSKSPSKTPKIGVKPSTFEHVTADTTDTVLESPKNVKKSTTENDGTSALQENEVEETTGTPDISVLPPLIHNHDSSSNTEPVDVSKILKIINVKSSDSVQKHPSLKGTFKPALKTYTNKRRNFNNRQYIVESFGLPDKPIFPVENKTSPLKEPKRIKTLDLAVGSCSEHDINLVDKQLLDTPWKIGSNSTPDNSDNGKETATEDDFAVSPRKRSTPKKSPRKPRNAPATIKFEQKRNGKHKPVKSQSVSPPRKQKTARIRPRSLNLWKKRTYSGSPDKEPPSKHRRGSKIKRNSSMNADDHEIGDETTPCGSKTTRRRLRYKSKGDTGTKEELDEVVSDLEAEEQHTKIVPVKVGLKTQDSDSIEKNEFGYKVGDLLWSRIGSYPFWPCLVTEDPYTSQHKKIISFKGHPHTSYHVRFFGDKGRRTWVYDTSVMKYNGRHDLKNILDNKFRDKSNSGVLLQAYQVKPHILSKWQVAVDEADSVSDKSVQDRLEFFSKMFEDPSVSRKRTVTSKAKNRTTLATKKETISTDSNPVSKQPQKKRTTDKPAVKNTRNRTKEHQTNDGNDWKILDLSKRQHLLSTEANSECSLSDTDSVSKSSSSTPIPNSFSAQNKRQRRNYLFKGVSRERVCQVCKNPGEILKCRGPCNGLFHYECGGKLCPVDFVKKEEPRETPESDLPDTTNPAGEKNTYADCDDSDLEHASIIPKPADREPRKLSLAEQIDQKMKEIMQKFETKTRYADSTTDYTSSEESSSNLPQVDDDDDDDEDADKSRVDSKKRHLKIQHVTADYISFASSGGSEELLCENLAVAEPQNNRKTDPQTIHDDQFKCHYCKLGTEPPCFVCEREVSNKNVTVRQKCSLHRCGKFYHPECLKMWPQTQWSLISVAKHKNSDQLLDTFVCPLHVCHTCASDNPHVAVSRCPSDKVVKCLRCPATYHTTNYCVPAGTVILSTSQIVCPRHLGRTTTRKGPNSTRTINTPWCFICSKGGDLICCETCPTSVHAECLQINLLEDGTFMCEDCETGRFPLYDEIVWVKLGTYRWWPAVILFPNEVPDNVRNMPHNRGEFVVKFFGTHDHYWVGRGRVFLFQEGDKGHRGPANKRVDNLFRKSIEEATTAHQLKKVFKSNKEAEIRTGMKPPPYIRIKVNKPVGNVRLFDGNVSNTTACECDPNQDHPCGPDSDCLNRLLLTECDPNICPAKSKCNNQRFEKRQYPPLLPYKTQARGWGLKPLAPIRKGDFIIEYVGEIIDEREYQRRIRKMHEQKDENYYFLTIDKDRIIDAGPKGNLARFMNHCCQPNCETQKWTVNGDTRVGLFALEDISVDSELTFNYNLECIGKEKKICKCGAPNCSGFIGVKVKSDESQKKPKKSSGGLKKKKQLEASLLLQTFKNDAPCFVCGKTEAVGSCHNKICTKSYHLSCVNLEQWPEGKWVCPWHNCNVCSKRTIRCCVKCINSYCPVHSEGNVRYDKLLGFVCTEHDPTKESQEIPDRKDAKSVPNLTITTTTTTTTEETDVTSTTSDEIDHRAGTIVRLGDKEEPDVQTGVTSTPPARDVPKPVANKNKRKRKAKQKNVTNSSKRIRLSVVDKRKVGESPSSSNPNTNSNLIEIPLQNEIKLSLSIPSRHLRAASRNYIGAKMEFKRFLKQQRNELEKDLPMRKRSRPRCEAST